MAGRRECRGEGAIGESMETIKKEIMKFFVGKEEVVDKVLICLLAGGHILLEDVPGVGKTTMAKAAGTSWRIRLPGQKRCMSVMLCCSICRIS